MASALLLSLFMTAGCATTRKAGEYGPGADLPYPPATRPASEDIYHVPTGLKMTMDGAMNMASSARLVCVGETHDNYNAQRVELIVIRDMYHRYPGKIAIGMEMFREPQQAALDKWVHGGFADEAEFLKAVQWYGNEGWSYDFAYYRDILNFAREKGIDIIALNPSRELETAVSRSGIDNLAPALKGRLPALGEIDPIQKSVLKSIFGGHAASSSDARFDGFIRTQMLWEETMAERIVGYLRSPRGEDKRVVTVTGGWHVRYGFGLPKKVVRRMPMAYSIIMPDEIGPPEDESAGQTMDVDLPPIPLLPSDFVWFVKYESYEGRRMRIGARLDETKGGEVVVEGLVPGSPGEAAGLRKGDTIFAFDGKPVKDAFDVIYPLTQKREGDTVTLVVRDDGQERTLSVKLFKMPKQHPMK
ncbi:MAG TPA: ChaN family lipoprotein [Candidatus Deferrimicrobiaceae bacterium]